MVNGPKNLGAAPRPVRSRETPGVAPDSAGPEPGPSAGAARRPRVTTGDVGRAAERGQIGARSLGRNAPGLDAGGPGPEAAKAAIKAAAAPLSRALQLTGAKGPPRTAQIVSALRASLRSLGPLEPATVPSGAAIPKLRALVAGLPTLPTADAEATRALLDARLRDLDTPRVFAELTASSPTPADRIDALIGGAPKPDGVRTMLAAMYPGAEALGTTPRAMRAALDADLAAGGLGKELAALLERHGVSSADADAFLGAFAEARAGFEAGTRSGPATDKDRDMQRTNWVHTRVEVVKAARAFDAVSPPDAKASPSAREAHADALLSTLLGSLFSDAFKDATPHSLLWHNRPGAELVLPLVAGRHFDLESPRMQGVLQTAMQLAHEHQITPPLFMAGAMKGQLLGAGAKPEVAEQVFTKLNQPLAALRDGTEIRFTADERAAMDAIGIPGWATMDPASAHFARSQVVAYADVLQYVAPDGVIKIAVDIRDPEQAAPFMRDPNVKAAIASSVEFSFARGMDVIEHETLKADGAKQQEAMRSLLADRAYPEVERRLRDALGVAADAPLPSVPYWNADVPTDGTIGDAERQSVRLVKQTLRDVLAELGGVPLDPFGAKKE